MASAKPATAPVGSADGVSLTVVEAGTDHFSVALIPTTLSLTTLGEREAGDLVNLEVDVLAKYVERLAAPHLARVGEDNGRGGEATGE